MQLKLINKKGKSSIWRKRDHVVRNKNISMRVIIYFCLVVAPRPEVLGTQWVSSSLAMVC